MNPHGGPVHGGSFRIVEKFGKDTLNIIEDTPDKLLTVQGIGKVRLDRIKTSWQASRKP